MLQEVQTGGAPGGVTFKMTLVPNRDSRPQYVTMIRYEQRWVPVMTDDGAEMEALRLVPVRRTLEWLKRDDGEEYLVCTRVTELRWREIRPTPAHRDMIDQWAQHLASVKKGARTIKVEVVP